MVARHLRRVRLTARRRADRPRRPDRRVGLRAEHVDHAARPPDRSRTPRVVQVDVEPDALGRPPADRLRRRRRRRRRPRGRGACSPRRADVGLPLAGGRRPDRRRRRGGATCRSTTRRRAERIDPRTLSVALDDLLPRERVVAVDSGNFMGYPSTYLSVPDEHGYCITQAFQSIGLGLATAIGAALAQPHRLPVAALGDGGALMGASELETVARLGLPMVVVVYNDAAYGAEVHHFGPARPRPEHGRVPRHRLRLDGARHRLRGGHRAHGRRPGRASRRGSPGRADVRCSSTPRSSPTSRRGGSRRPSAATESADTESEGNWYGDLPAARRADHLARRVPGDRRRAASAPARRRRSDRRPPSTRSPLGAARPRRRRVPDRAQVGGHRGAERGPAATSSATAPRASRARSRTAPCCGPTRTSSSRA